MSPLSFTQVTVIPPNIVSAQYRLTLIDRLGLCGEQYLHLSVCGLYLAVTWCFPPWQTCSDMVSGKKEVFAATFASRVYV